MTLILGGVTRGYVFHASDRLTTITPTKKNPDKAWDIHANKTVIVVGSDCWLVIGYTGLAYLDGRPTDDFIASVLANGADLSGGMGVWFSGRPLHYREITSSIERAIHDAYSRLPIAARAHRTIVSGVGVQIKTSEKPNYRHVAFRGVITHADHQHFELAKPHQPTSRFVIEAVGSYDLDIHNDMRARLRANGDDSPEAFRDIMMDAVAKTGSQSDVVGEDVMGVILEPIARKIRVHFRTANAITQAELANATGSFGDETANIPNVSTPYILVPGQYFSPAVASGGWHLSPSEIDIELTGFDREPTPGPVRGFWGSHPRRAQPS